MCERMNKLVQFIIAALFIFLPGKTWAVFGIPDEVPAATLLYPFFKVDPEPTATSRQDTLIVVTNTANPPTAFAVLGGPSSSAHTWVHFTLWNTKSEHVFNFSVQLTPHDVFSCSLSDLLINPNQLTKPCGIAQAPLVAREQLKVGDILAGYITVDTVTGPTALFPGQLGYPFASWNTLIGHSYLVDLPAGSATGFNAVSIEANTTLDPLAIGHRARGFPGSTSFYLNRCLESNGGDASTLCQESVGGAGNRERIDGPSGAFFQNLSFTGRTPTGPFDAPLSLLIRYFSVPTLGGKTEIWLWKDRVTATGGSGTNVGVYDEDENVHSISLQLADEVNFTSTAGLLTPGVPGGWFRIKFTCSGFGSCGYAPDDPAGLIPPHRPWVSASGTLQTPIQAVAYSVQFARSDNAALRWDAVFPAHRQYSDFIGGAQAE